MEGNQQKSLQGIASDHIARIREDDGHVVHCSCDHDLLRVHESIQRQYHDVTDALIQVLLQRRARGIQKYGTSLKTFNGRDWKWDLLEEMLDALQYLMQGILEDMERER